jgi:hypothetical protein
MDRTSLHQRLQAVDALLQRMQENIAFQGRMIATLDRGGHDTRAAKMFLRRLEATHARHVADRDRLFKELANRSCGFLSGGNGGREQWLKWVWRESN